MFKDSLEWAVAQINKCFHLSSEVDSYMISLGGPALKFTQDVWDVAMILASVVFAIVACYELYAIAVRTEARGGPMGSTEVAFKVLFKVAVCFLPTMPDTALNTDLFNPGKESSIVARLLVAWLYSVADQILGRYLIDPAEIGRLGRDECLVLITGIAPFRSKKLDTTKRPRYEELK